MKAKDKNAFDKKKVKIKNRQRIIGITRKSQFIGERKVGLDTNILIKLYDNPYLFEYEESRIFRYPNLVFIHVINKYELIEYLVKKGSNEEEARLKIGSLIREKNIRVIYPKDVFIPEGDILRFEDAVNKRLQEIGKPYLKCHKPDSIILLAFKKVNISRIISTDEAFREGAKFLGIDGGSLPSLNSKISKELRRIFDYKRKYKRIK